MISGIDTHARGHSHHATASTITLANRWYHFRARRGMNRTGHRAEPDLCALRGPTPSPPVCVPANYALRFNRLQSVLVSIDGYIMVLNAKGISMRCPAGKGTSGTDERVDGVEVTAFHRIVTHRLLILPQSGATGVAAHEVTKRYGLTIQYGPVRTADLPHSLKTREATSGKRTVRCVLRDRFIVIPAELTRALLPGVIAAVLLYFIGAIMASAASLAAILSSFHGSRLPTSAQRGYILGGMVIIPFAFTKLLGGTLSPLSM